MSNLELYKIICEELPSNSDIEDMEPIEVKGVKYNSEEVERLATEDEGKYQYGGCIYGIGIHNEAEGHGITGKPLFYVQQDFTQTGSYYSHQEREYEEPYIVERKEVTRTIWKAVK